MHIKIKTGYSFRHAYGNIPDILDLLKGHSYAGICDRDGTWGFYEWERECLKRNIKPVFGVELAVVPDADNRERTPCNHMSFIALNENGIYEINDLVGLATEKYYYYPRIGFDAVLGLSDDVAILSGENLVVIFDIMHDLRKKKHFYLEKTPELLDYYENWHTQAVYSCANLYPKASDEYAYQVAVGQQNPQLNQGFEFHLRKRDITQIKPNENNDYIGSHTVILAKNAKIVKPKTDKPFDVIVFDSARNMIDLNNPIYKTRLEFELSVLKSKKFEDYFLIVYDLVKYARAKMIVGAGRGSSCGSLVCYVLGITLIDPIPFNLLFERFIDLNRDDYPDIDIDFPDNYRDDIFRYLRLKYGYSWVAKLGTLSKFKAKSALIDTQKALCVPVYALNKLKDCLEDTLDDKKILGHSFDETLEGIEFISQYPEMRIAQEIEGHVRHSGVHAAGIVISDRELNFYCAVDERIGALQIDKFEAERIGLLKVDVLGLRTLTVIQTTLDMIGKTVDYIQKVNLDCRQSFDVLQDRRFSGIFQFEGAALQSITNQMTIESFEDIVALTSLCRPGVMQCGGTARYLRNRNGKESPYYVNNTVKAITQTTYGVLVYQEQIMQIAKDVAGFDNKKVTILRKAISKAKGDDVVRSLENDFIKGATAHGLTDDQAQDIWGDMETMGAYAFNRSHAVAYAMMSYWCMYLKAHHPLEFACASLRHAKDEDQSIQILRDLDKEGYQYKIYDKKESRLDWEVKDGKLVGALTNIKGVGIKTAEEIIRKRENNIDLTERQEKLVTDGVTPYDSIFQTRVLWGHVLNDPEKYGVKMPISMIESIQENSVGTFLILAKIDELVLKNINAPEKVVERGGKVMPGDPHYLLCKAIDDTGKITLVFNRKDYQAMGRQLKDEHKVNDYYLILGESSQGFKTLNVVRYKKITDNEDYKL